MISSKSDIEKFNVTLVNPAIYNNLHRKVTLIQFFKVYHENFCHLIFFSYLCKNNYQRLDIMETKTPTPHIGAQYGEIAETVIMAGDPLRAKFMAENFLENPVQFNNVRGMLGFTGTHHGKRVSVMGHGMGMPSLGIYTYELYNFYGVKTIVRVGSAGSINPDLHIGDLVIAMGACTNSNYASQYELPGTFAPIADFDLLRKAADTCEKIGVNYRVGNVFSSDVFYAENAHNDKWMQMGVLAVEMEVAALYMNAARSGNKALAICTISDHILTGEVTTAEQRQLTFTKMMDVAFSLI